MHAIARTRTWPRRQSLLHALCKKNESKATWLGPSDCSSPLTASDLPDASLNRYCLRSVSRGYLLDEEATSAGLSTQELWTSDPNKAQKFFSKDRAVWCCTQILYLWPDLTTVELTYEPRTKQWFPAG